MRLRLQRSQSAVRDEARLRVATTTEALAPQRRSRGGVV